VQWKSGKTAFGVEYRSENILSNVLGEELDKPQDVPGEDAEFTKSASRNTVSVFLEHVLHFNRWTFTAGLMGNHISESNLGINLFPGIDAGCNITPVLKLYGSFNTSLRMPTFTDLYYAGPTNIGNPGLKPEKSATIEGGVKLNDKFVGGHIVVFYRNGKDIIDWVKTGNEDIWQPQNLTRLNSIGTEIQVQFSLKKKYGGFLPDKLVFSYFYNHLEKEDFDFISNYVLDNLKHKLVAGINQSIKNLSFDLKILFQDREGTYTEFINGNYGNEMKYNPFWIFDAKINYSWNSISTFVSVNNIFDVQYNDIGNVAQPGRWIKAGIVWEINID
jgi:iron complex outermembrane receptor protein